MENLSPNSDEKHEVNQKTNRDNEHQHDDTMMDEANGSEEVHHVNNVAITNPKAVSQSDGDVVDETKSVNTVPDSKCARFGYIGKVNIIDNLSMSTDEKHDVDQHDDTKRNRADSFASCDETKEEVPIRVQDQSAYPSRQSSNNMYIGSSMIHKQEKEAPIIYITGALLLRVPFKFVRDPGVHSYFVFDQVIVIMMVYLPTTEGTAVE